jgi:hypothetical protein
MGATVTEEPDNADKLDSTKKRNQRRISVIAIRFLYDRYIPKDEYQIHTHTFPPDPHPSQKGPHVKNEPINQIRASSWRGTASTKTQTNSASTPFHLIPDPHRRVVRLPTNIKSRPTLQHLILIPRQRVVALGMSRSTI